MYTSDLKSGYKGGALLAVAVIHAGLLFAFLNMAGAIDVIDTQAALKIINLDQEPPPPPVEPPPPPPQQQQSQRTPEPEGGASPENIRSQATPIQRIEPEIEVPAESPIATSDTPREGTDATQGASDVAGPGTGSGGAGTGTGSGAGGGGPGGGGGGVAVSPALVRGITQRDYPDAVQRRWPRGGRIFLRLRIEPNGRPSQCDVMRGFGNQAADQWTCRLIMDRGVFRPARNARGEPVAAWFGYVQSDTGRRVR